MHGRFDRALTLPFDVLAGKGGEHPLVPVFAFAVVCTPLSAICMFALQSPLMPTLVRTYMLRALLVLLDCNRDHASQGKSLPQGVT